MKKRDLLGDELTKLAHGIIKDVSEQAIDKRVDALKAVTTFYLGKAKIDGKLKDDDDDPDAGLPGMRAKIRAVGG